jgi:hypothetical protein
MKTAETLVQKITNSLRSLRSYTQEHFLLCEMPDVWYMNQQSKLDPRRRHPTDAKEDWESNR